MMEQKKLKLISLVAYIDSTGIGVWWVPHQAQESGSVLVVAILRKTMERVFSLLGVDKDLNVLKMGFGNLQALETVQELVYTVQKGIALCFGIGETGSY